MTSPTAIVLMGHGTDDETGQKQFLETAQLLSETRPESVYPGFIESAFPTMFEAADRALADGHNHIVVLPLILLPAGHLKDDAAILTRYLRGKGARVSMALDIGIQTELIDLYVQRITEVDSPGSLLAVGRGSTDASANAGFYAISRLAMERLDFIPTEACFVSLAPPDVTAGLERLRHLEVDAITVAPYFLFRGKLLDRIAEQAMAWSKTTRVPVSIARELGVDPLVCRALERRLDQAGSVANLNCDTCKWRTT